MGNMYVPIKVLLDTIGIEYVMPPFYTKGNLELGVSHSPEFACLPFKTILGDFIYGIEHGAEFILFGGGCGQCRLGYYGDLQAEILKSLKYKTEFVCLDLSNMTVNEVLKNLKPVTAGKSIWNIIRGIVLATRTVFMVDGLNKLARYTRCREINKGQTDRIISQFHIKAQKAAGYKKIKKLILSSKKALNETALDKDYKPLKVSIVGEMYVAAHPQINFDIERKLGNMGVEVYNNLSVSQWITNHFLKKMLPIKLKNKPHEAGKEYIKTDDIGGHGIYTVGCSIMSAKKNFDGVLHLYPFTCLPEIIAQSTFSEIQKKYGIPIMTLIIDEITGEAGYMTRLEAFVDLLARKRESAKPNNGFRITNGA